MHCRAAFWSGAEECILPASSCSAETDRRVSAASFAIISGLFKRNSPTLNNFTPKILISKRRETTKRQVSEWFLNFCLKFQILNCIAMQNKKKLHLTDGALPETKLNRLKK